jgi:hypothetical protein
MSIYRFESCILKYYHYLLVQVYLLVSISTFFLYPILFEICTSTLSKFRNGYSGMQKSETYLYKKFVSLWRSCHLFPEAEEQIVWLWSVQSWLRLEGRVFITILPSAKSS